MLTTLEHEMGCPLAESHLAIPALLGNGAGHEVVEVTPRVAPADLDVKRSLISRLLEE